MGTSCASNPNHGHKQLPSITSTRILVPAMEKPQRESLILRHMHTFECYPMLEVVATADGACIPSTFTTLELQSVPRLWVTNSQVLM
jgi:hypothetical protein